MQEPGAIPQQPEVAFDTPTGDVLLVRFRGSWRRADYPPSAESLIALLEASPSELRIRFDAREITDWDTGLLTFLTTATRYCSERGISVDPDGLPPGARRLLRLAAAVPATVDARKEVAHEPFLAHIGNKAVQFARSVGELLSFLGETLLAFGRMARGKAIFRPVDLGLLLQGCGAEALPIVTLISTLVGMILAFVGAYQLRMFGAEVYVAAGVGLGMVREMAPLMTGIIMAGRTGAAFAAQIGTMQVNEEVDALRTMRISPVEFLVLPRMIALALMMPLLCLYADVMGILGGAVVGWSMFGIPLAQYFQQTRAAVGLDDVGIGILKAVIFGMVVAAAGCLRGMQCGRSASAVGEATTSAVVTGIVAIIVLDSVAAIISTVLGV